MRLTSIDSVTNLLVELYPQGLLKDRLDSLINKTTPLTTDTIINHINFPDGTQLGILVVGPQKTQETQETQESNENIGQEIGHYNGH